MSQRAVFGLQAGVYASQIAREAPVILADPGGAGEALAEGVRRRGEGRYFAVWPLLIAQRAAQALEIGANLAQAFADEDERRAAFGQLARGTLAIDGKPQHTVTFTDPRRLEALGDLLYLAERTVAQSWTEVRHLYDLFPHMPPPLIAPPVLPDDLVPGVRAANGRHVVVWAPRLEARETAIFAFALRELRLPVIIVAHDAAPDLDGARVIGPADAPAALSAARVIVDASLGKASTALALAQIGAGMAVAATSGADEYLRGVQVYHPWDAANIYAAAGAALAAPAPQILPFVARPLEGAIEPSDPQDGPLVSIIIRTRDRREFLERALASVAAQRYRNLEAIVVNDGGAAVDDLIERHTFARLVEHASSRGRSAAANAGLHAAQGVYAGLLDDDDVLFADHVPALVAALERSGAAAAVSGAVSAFTRRAGASYFIDGYKMTLAGHSDRLDLHTQDPIAPMAVMLRRSILERTGMFDETLNFAEDWELWLRIAQSYDFVYVPRVTAMYTVRQGDENAMSAPGLSYAQTLRVMQSRYPLAGRPDREQLRQSMLDTYASGEVAARWPQPSLRLVPPEPLRLR